MIISLKPAMRLPSKPFQAQAYAWPGGYQIVYYDLHNGDSICPDCATFERFKVKLTPDVFWEGPPEYCANCNAEIESSYGDPAADESEES